MDPLSNPFRPGAGTRPPALVGRDDLIDAFGLAARRALSGRPGKSLMPIGLRGVGKTVLVNRFCEIAEDEGFSVGFIEAPETGDFRTLLAVRLRRVLLGLDQGATRRAALKALRALKSFSLQLPDGSSISLDVSPESGLADSGILAEDVTDLLVLSGEAARDRGAGVLLAIDEVQYLSESELAALITAIHRTTQLGLPVVLVGAGLPQLPGIAGEAKSYAERLFDFPMIDSLDADQSRDALSIPVRDQGSEITDGALDLLVDISKGYPYFIQEWGYHVWDHADTSPITADDVRSVTPSVTEHLDRNFFMVRFDRLTPREKDYLSAMAEMGPGPHRSGDVAATLGSKVEAVAPRRAGLISKGMIYSPAHGDTAFTVPLFDDFLRRFLPATGRRGS